MAYNVEVENTLFMHVILEFNLDIFNFLSELPLILAVDPTARV